jgi:hypothetical protein
MKRRSAISISVAPALVLLQCFSITAFAAEKAIPKGCVKLEDEVKFSGKNIYVSELGHLTAGKLLVAPLTSIDPTAADAIRSDGIPDLKDDENTLTKGEVTLTSTPLPDGPAVTSFNNDPINPRASITLKVQKKDDENADISGTIKLKPTEVAWIKLKNMNPKALDTPISICGVGMQLYLKNGQKKIDKGTVILYINNGSDQPVAIEALYDGRGSKAVSQAGFQMAADVAPQDLVGVGQAL